jgi:hypothetical protein
VGERVVDDGRIVGDVRAVPAWQRRSSYTNAASRLRLATAEAVRRAVTLGPINVIEQSGRCRMTWEIL